MKIKFSKNIGQHYYRYHYTFLLNIFKEARADIELCPSTELDTTRYTININGQDVLIDVSDDPALYSKVDDYKYCFKYHYSEGIHENCKNVFPLGAMNFYNWDEYFELEPQIKYTCNSNIVLNNQRIYANALQRRTTVKIMLKTYYKDLYDNELTDQVEYWKKINNCLVSVHVPGYRNDILDRGQFQMMAFGCCTISPKLLTVLPFGQTLVPGFHYITCKYDYSDLIDKIEWCKKNREKCIEIGKNAKHLFMAFCLPRQIVKWMERCLKN